MTANLPRLDFRKDDLSGKAVQELIAAHLAQMKSQTPIESVYALDLTGLKSADVTVWSVWEDEDLVACGALKEIDADHGEIKSMHTAMERRGRGIGRATLKYILGEARRRGYRKLSLETGRTPSFAAALALYKGFGFKSCGPFGDYTLDPHSAYFTLEPLPPA